MGAVVSETPELPETAGGSDRPAGEGVRKVTDASAPTLESINRRRLELWVITFVLLFALALAFVALSFAEEPPAWFVEFGGSANAARASLVALAVGFFAYVLDKERRMRRLTARLINSRVLEAALMNRLNEVASLGEASSHLRRALDLDEALEAILRIGLELLEADEGSLMLAEDQGLVVAAAVGRARMFTGQRVGLDEGLAGQVATSRQALILEGSDEGEHPGGIRWAMSVPMETEGELIGVLNLSVVSGSRTYNEYDLRALGLFAEQAGLTIRDARARRRDRVRAEMAASMADDLREPLHLIQRTVAMLAREGDQLPEEKRAETLRWLEREVDRVVDLVRWISGRRDGS